MRFLFKTHENIKTVTLKYTDNDDVSFVVSVSGIFNRRGQSLRSEYLKTIREKLRVSGAGSSGLWNDSVIGMGEGYTEGNSCGTHGGLRTLPLVLCYLAWQEGW